MPEENSSIALIRYLLRELPEDQIEEIEQKYFSDEEFFEELQCVEAELIDSYVAGGLELEQKKKFEQLYLSVQEGKSRIQFAEALRVKALEMPLLAGESAPFRKWTAVRLLAAALVVFAIAGAWLVRELIQVRAENQSAQQKIERLQHELEKQSKARDAKIQELAKELDAAQMAEDSKPPQPIHGSQPKPTFLAVLMTPGLSRDASGMQTIAISHGIDFIRFELKLDRDPFSAYRVSLQTAGGDELWDLGLLKASMTAAGKTVVFDLPSNRVEQRDYVLLLQGESAGNKFENVSAYPFRVKKAQ